MTLPHRIPGLILVALLIVVVIVGCGGGSSEESRVEDAVTGYLTAFSAGDGTGACEQFSGEEARSIFEEAVVELPELQARSCGDALTALSESLGGAEKEELANAEVGTVKVHGDTATATIIGGTKAAELEKVGGRWVISGGIGLGP